ncbi:PPXXXP-CTERM sorting domain-containing NosD-like protein, partial [Candidatus Acetothermia bacterium]
MGRILLVLTVGIVLLGAVSAWANDLYVDPMGTGGAYTSIQAAIGDAVDGDTIHVAAGTYNEDVRIDKSLTLVSVDGKDTTIINGQNTGGGGALTVAGGLSGVVIGGTGTGFTINAAGGTA